MLKSPKSVIIRKKRLTYLKSNFDMPKIQVNFPYIGIGDCD
jgi:hypothetical protein